MLRVVEAIEEGGRASPEPTIGERTVLGVSGRCHLSNCRFNPETVHLGALKGLSSIWHFQKNECTNQYHWSLHCITLFFRINSLEKVRGATQIGATGLRASEREICL